MGAKKIIRHIDEYFSQYAVNIALTNKFNSIFVIAKEEV